MLEADMSGILYARHRICAGIPWMEFMALSMDQERAHFLSGY